MAVAPEHKAARKLAARIAVQYPDAGVSDLHKTVYAELRLAGYTPSLAGLVARENIWGKVSQAIR